MYLVGWVAFLVMCFQVFTEKIIRTSEVSETSEVY